MGSPAHLAQRYLASAYDTVANLVLVTYPALRAQRDASRGRLTHAEQDLLEGCVVFSGAGVDAVLKEAMRSCVPLRVAQATGARDKYLEFVTRHLQVGAEIQTRRLAELLIDDDPRASLLDSYVHSLTGSSLQSQSQVTASLAALGLQGDKQLFVDSSQLNPLFKTRNEIAHEMDMTPAAVRNRNGRTRRERAITSYIDMCHHGLDYCQRVLNTLQRELTAGH